MDSRITNGSSRVYTAISKPKCQRKCSCRLATLFRHAIGHWGWRDFEKHYQETPVHPNAGVGILLKTLAVVDADSAEEVTRWETEWPVLHSVPMETTSKGAHYYFRARPDKRSTEQTGGFQVYHWYRHCRYCYRYTQQRSGTFNTKFGKQTCCTYDLCISGTRGEKVSYAMSYVQFISST